MRCKNTAVAVITTPFYSIVIKVIVRNTGSDGLFLPMSHGDRIFDIQCSSGLGPNALCGRADQYNFATLCFKYRS